MLQEMKERGNYRRGVARGVSLIPTHKDIGFTLVARPVLATRLSPAGRPVSSGSRRLNVKNPHLVSMTYRRLQPAVFNGSISALGMSMDTTARFRAVTAFNRRYLTRLWTRENI